MSRVGRKPVPIPAGVEVTLEGPLVRVKGPKGTLEREFHPDMRISLGDRSLKVERPSDEPFHRALHGLTRVLLANMVTGVTQGFEKSLQLEGVGYRAARSGKKLVLTVGYSHPVEMEPPAGIEFDVPAPNRVVVRGADKELVGQVAARVREVRPPEPYKGKGIMYAGERIRRKAGKAGKK
ncbi:MAG: 50S ribosomal protein L6 [Bacillota bacterium]|nr:50S ribosomal protein L6 [Bacillota bacterium]